MNNIDHLVTGDNETIILPHTSDYNVAFLELCRRNKIDETPDYFVDSIDSADNLIAHSEELGQERYLVLSRGIVAGSVEVSDIVPTLHSTKEISIFMDKDYRGVGLGTLVIDTLSRHYLDKPETEEVVAFTRDVNIPCIRALEKAHFYKTSEVAGSSLRYSRR